MRWSHTVEVPRRQGRGGGKAGAAEGGEARRVEQRLCPRRRRPWPLCTLGGLLELDLEVVKQVRRLDRGLTLQQLRGEALGLLRRQPEAAVLEHLPGHARAGRERRASP